MFGFAARLTAVAALAMLPRASAAQDAGAALRYEQGPGTFSIGGSIAEIDLDANYLFMDEAGTRTLLELTENPLTGTEAGAVMPASEHAGWFLIFEWDAIGYVPDEEKDQLDAEAIFESVRSGTEAMNEERRSRGWPAFTVIGWQERPHYDDRTNNLTWAIIGESAGERSVNRLVKLLGRRGVMTATLVAGADELPLITDEVDALLARYRFQPGSTYAEYVPGSDKLAEIGLTALVVGGAGAALVKSGLLARMWKLIVVGVVAVGAGIRRFFTGARAEEQETSSV